MICWWAINSVYLQVCADGAAWLQESSLSQLDARFRCHTFLLCLHKEPEAYTKFSVSYFGFTSYINFENLLYLSSFKLPPFGLELEEGFRV